jgi:hypothetical protein
MNAFIRTLAFGLAGLCVFLITVIVGGLLVLKSKGALEPKAWRDAVLEEDEKAFLQKMHERTPEPPPAAPVSASEDELLERIAEMANADRASQLVSELRKQRQSLDERQALLDQQWAELQLSKADLVRMQAQLKAQQDEIKKAKLELEAVAARYAKTRELELQHGQALGKVELARYEEQAKLFEQMKEGAWQSLRRFKPEEIARYMYYMGKSNPKIAAKIMVLAQNDNEYPELGMAVQRAMLTFDPDGKSGDQIERMARLYEWMQPDAIVSSLRDSSTDEVAEVLLTMERIGTAEKKRADILEALRKDNSKREMEIRRILEAKPVAKGANP